MMDDNYRQGVNTCLQIVSYLPIQRENRRGKALGEPRGSRCVFLWGPPVMARDNVAYQQLVLEGILQAGKDWGGAQADHRVL
jgi:hypothetical protein